MPMLTKRLVNAVAPQETEYQIFDGDIPGLALRVHPNSQKICALFYRTATGRKRTLTLGKHGAITPEQARRLAKDRLAEVTRVTRGGDPAGERQRVRHAPDLAALVERYRLEHLAHKKASTRARAEGLLKSIILPALGKMKAEAVTRADVLALHRTHRATPVEANRAITLLSGIFTWAEDEGVVPRRGQSLPPHQEAPGAASRALPLGPGARPPGQRPGPRRARRERARRGDPHHPAAPAQGLSQERDPEPPLGRRRPRERLPSPARFEDRSQDGPPRCACSQAPGRGGTAGSMGVPGRARRRAAQKPIQALGPRLQGRWRRRGEAARPEAQLRLGRHAGDESLALVGAIVGHSTMGMTQRYAHLSVDPVRATADRISAAIAAAMGGTDPAQVLTINRRPTLKAETRASRDLRLIGNRQTVGDRTHSPPSSTLLV